MWGKGGGARACGAGGTYPAEVLMVAGCGALSTWRCLESRQRREGLTWLGDVTLTQPSSHRPSCPGPGLAPLDAGIPSLDPGVKT